MLPVVDKPSIQYVVEEAVARRSHRHPHHHRTGQARHRGPLRPQLRARALPRAVGQARPPDGGAGVQRPRATSTTSARRDPLGLGHAVCVAREHVGDEPFAVILGDDIMVDNRRLLRSMLDVHDRVRPLGASRCGTWRREEISAYGCVGARGRRRRPRAGPRRHREAEARGRSVQPRRHRPLRVHAGIFDALDRITPGVGGELQLTDAIGLLNQLRDGVRAVFTDGRYDIGQKLDFLRANIELALDRPDLGPGASCRRTVPRHHLIRAPAARSGRSALGRAVSRSSGSDPAPAQPRRRPIPLADASGWCSRRAWSPAPEPVPPFANTAMDGYAVRGGRHRWARPKPRPSGCEVVGRAPGRVTRRPWRSARGEAIRIMTGAPMPDGADAIVMVERTERDRARRRDDGVLGDARGRTGTARAGRAGGDLEAGDVVFAPGTRPRPRASRRARVASASPRPRRTPRVRVGVLSTGDELRRGSVSCRRDRSVTPTARCCWRCSPRRVADAVDLGIGSRRRGRP